MTVEHAGDAEGNLPGRFEIPICAIHLFAQTPCTRVGQLPLTLRLLPKLLGLAALDFGGLPGLLRELALMLGARLGPAARNKAGERGCKNERRGGDREPAAAKKPARQVSGGVAACLHRKSFEIALQIEAQRFHRRIAAIRFFAECAKDDVRKIAPNSGPQLQWIARRPILDGAQTVLKRRLTQLERRIAGQKLIKNPAQRVNVGSCGSRFASHLFWAGILESQRQRLCFSDMSVIAQDTGDAEIQQLYHAVRGDENIARFDVAMDDEMTVGTPEHTARNSSTV